MVPVGGCLKLVQSLVGFLDSFTKEVDYFLFERYSSHSWFWHAFRLTFNSSKSLDENSLSIYVLTYPCRNMGSAIARAIDIAAVSLTAADFHSLRLAICETKSFEKT